MFKRVTKLLMTAMLVGTMLVSNLVTVFAAPSNVEVQDLFDAEYYAAQNPDVKAAFGNDAEALLNHYLTYGMKEGRTFSRAFDLNIYKALYPDLVKAFGDNWELYVTHYLNFGITEQRDGGGEFDVVAYAKNNPDLVNEFGFDFKALKNHYDTVGKAEGRVAVSVAKSEQSKPVATATTSSSSNENKSDKKPSTPAKPVVKYEYLQIDDAYYNYTLYQKAFEAWYDSEPCVDDYLDVDAYNEAYSEWEGLEPSKDDYIFAYEDADAAQSAYESAHEDWELHAPVREDFVDTDAYDEAMEEYVAENPEPVVEDYPYFEDGYNDEEAAQLAFDAAYEAHMANSPEEEDFLNEAEFESAMTVYNANEPKVGDYVYVENTYANADEAAQAYTVAHTNWETAKATALEGLEVDTEEYNTALETFLASNAEPQSEDYTYHENEYESQEEADEAYNLAHQQWQGEVPNQSDYIDTDEYNNAVKQHTECTPVVDDFTAKINEYESQEAATEAFNTAHENWEANAPKEEDFIDEEWYNYAVEDYEASEPQEEDFVSKEDLGEDFVNEYDSKDEADAAYEEAFEEWHEQAPAVEDYADGYVGAHDDWIEEEPMLEDFEVEKEDIPEGSEIIVPMG